MTIAAPPTLEKRGNLIGGAATDEVMDSSRSIFDAARGAAGTVKGLQQHFTPPEIAHFVAKVLGRGGPALDFTAGTGAMLSGFRNAMGIEIDADLTKGVSYNAIQGDAQNIVPMIRMTELRFPVVAINPPFGLDDWHDTVHAKAKINSTILSFLWALDLLKSDGHGAMLCGTDRLYRQVLGRPEADAIYAIIDIKGPVWSHVALPCSLAFFVRQQNRREGSKRLHFEAAGIHELGQHFSDIYRAHERGSKWRAPYSPSSYEIDWMRQQWHAVKEEAARRQLRRKAERGKVAYDISLKGSKIHAYPRAFAKLALSKQKRLRDIELLNSQSVNYFAQNKRTWKLIEDLEAKDALSVQPALKERVAKIISQAELYGTPLYPLKPQMRLGWVTEENRLLCKKTDPARGFVEGTTYPVATDQVTSQEQEYKEYEKKDGNKEIRLFTTERKLLQVKITSPKGEQLFNESPENILYLLEYFDLPDPGDVKTKFPEQVQAMEDVLRNVEREIQDNFFRYQEEQGIRIKQKFRFKNFQIDDLSRLLTRSRGLLAHEQGLGKTLQLMALARASVMLGAKDKYLQVVPQDLIPQWQREAKKFFGRQFEVIRNAADARRVRRHLLNGGTGWYLTYFEALSIVGRKKDFCTDVAADPGVALKIRRMAYKKVKKVKIANGISKPSVGAHELLGASKEIGLNDEGETLYATNQHGCPKCQVDTANGWNAHAQVCHECGYTHRRILVKPAYAYLTKCFKDGVVGIDELSEIRGDDSLRSKATRALSRGGKWKWGATGTPLSNYINDAYWGLWFALGNATIAFPYDYKGGKTKFEQDFCVIEYMHGSSEKDEEHKKVRAKTLPKVTNVSRFWRLAQPGVSRRRKEHTGEPLIERTFYPTSVPMGVAQQKLNQFWLDNFADYFIEHNPNHKLVEAGMVEKFEQALGQRWRMEYAATMPAADEPTQTWRRFRDRDPDGNPEYPWYDSVSNYTPANLKVLELAMKHAERGEKVLIGSDIIATGLWIAQRLNEKGCKTVHITEEKNGKVATKNPKKRSADVARFVEGDASVMCAGVAAMKLGHNMDVASCVIVQGLPDSYMALDQFIARVHRLTSKKPVSVYVVIPNGSLTADKWQVLKDKGGASDLAFDGELSLQNEDAIDWATVLKELKKRGIPARGDEIAEADVEAAWKAMTFTSPKARRVPTVQHSPTIPEPDKTLGPIVTRPIFDRTPKNTSAQANPRTGTVKDYQHRCGVILFQPGGLAGAWHYRMNDNEGKTTNNLCPYCDKPIRVSDLKEPDPKKKLARKPKPKQTDSSEPTLTLAGTPSGASDSLSLF